MFIIHAEIEPMEGAYIPDGFLLARGGHIAAIGAMADCPQNVDETPYDAHGAFLMPALVDAHCHLGMWSEGLGFEGDDGNEDSDPCTPQLRGLDGIKVDVAFTEAAQAGVGTVVTGPGSANPIAGQMCALKTVGRRVDKMLLKEPLAMKFAMGENPKRTYHEKELGPVTRMGIASIIREQLTKAQRYLEQKERAAQDEDEDEPEFDAKLEALLPVLSREIQAHFHAHALDDIFTALRITREFSLDTVIVHGTESYLAAQELAEEGVRIITGPLLGTRMKPELARMSIRSPGLLHEAGVPLAICTDHPELPIQYLMLCAKTAAEHGLAPKAALHAVTLGAAKLCGLSARVGSLVVGKDADAVLYAGNPMTTTCSRPLAVWIDGSPVEGLEANL